MPKGDPKFSRHHRGHPKREREYRNAQRRKKQRAADARRLDKERRGRAKKRGGGGPRKGGTTSRPLAPERPLVSACEKGRFEDVKALISSHDVEATGMTLKDLMNQVGSMSVPSHIVSYFGGSGRSEGTPLAAAVLFEHLQIVQYLIEECEVDPNIAGGGGTNILHAAASSNKKNTNVIQLLLDHMSYDSINKKCDGGYTPLDFVYRMPELRICQEKIDLIRKHGGKTGCELCCCELWRCRGREILNEDGYCNCVLHRVALFADVIMCLGLILIMGAEGIIYSDSDRDAKEKNDRGLNKTGINGQHIGGFVLISISLVIWIGQFYLYCRKSERGDDILTLSLHFSVCGMMTSGILWETFGWVAGFPALVISVSLFSVCVKLIGLRYTRPTGPAFEEIRYEITFLPEHEIIGDFGQKIITNPLNSSSDSYKIEMKHDVYIKSIYPSVAKYVESYGMKVGDSIEKICVEGPGGFEHEVVSLHDTTKSLLTHERPITLTCFGKRYNEKYLQYWKWRIRINMKKPGNVITCRLHGMGITDNDIVAICAILKTNNTIERLNLNYNNITDVQSIGELLETNNTLRCLELKHNNITDVQSICEALKTNYALHRLHLYGNNIPDVEGIDWSCWLYLKTEIRERLSTIT